MNALLKKHTGRPGIKCRLSETMSRLKPDQAEVVNMWMGDDDVQASAIARALQELTGAKISHEMIARHRRGDCVSCG